MTPRNNTETWLHNLTSAVFEEHLHARRVLSLENATVGAMHAASLGVHAIGLGLAAAKDLNPKHTIKQVDRLLSNPGLIPWDLFATWVPFVIGSRKDVLAAIDWTDFEKDDQATIAIHLVTSHGRATPLLWMTVVKSELAGWRNEHEDRLLGRLKEVLPAGVHVTLLADRAFGDQKLYGLMKELGFDYVIRFREIIQVEDESKVAKPAGEWVPSNGRAKKIPNAKVTADKCEIPAFVCVKARGMKEAWCLASSLADASASATVATYGRRFTIEENFRDTKDIRFGLGLAATRIRNPARRDRLLLIGAIAVALLTILGAAGESLGMDRLMKANTVKRRTHSLFRQGYHYYDSIPMMRDEKLKPLMAKFQELLREQKAFRDVFGII
jgi:hypothetical protein